MKNYDIYKAEDFALDGEFRDWVQGKSKNSDFWFAFVQQHPEMQEVISQAEELVRAMRVQTEPLPERQVRAEINRFIEKASQTPSNPGLVGHPLRRTISLTPTIRYAAAVILLGFMFIAGWLLDDKKANNEYESEMVSFEETDATNTETRNSTNRPLRLLLSDGSVVLLGPKSVLRYAPQFSGKDRIVYLKGEGQFDVVKQKRPFIVYAGGLVTRVLGTRFSIRAFKEDRKVSVQVQSGKVSVKQKELEVGTANTDQNGIILLPNQAAIYNQTEGQLVKTIVSNPIIQVPQVTEANFEFKEVPLSKVLMQIQQAYGIPIQFDEEVVRDYKITASLNHETMIEKIDILCKLVGGQYEIVDGQIIIRADGYH